MLTSLKIKELREKRLEFLEGYEKKLAEIEKDPKISEQYRQEQMTNLKSELHQKKVDYENRIEELIESGKQEQLEQMQEAEFNGMNEKELLKIMIIESRHKDLTNALMHRYKNDVSQLTSETRVKVQKNETEAPAYINALKQLADHPTVYFTVDELEQTYKHNNLNKKQKEHLKLYNEIIEQEEAYKEDKANEAFRNILHKYK